jgi:hypothetical protein
MTNLTWKACAIFKGENSFIRAFNKIPRFYRELFEWMRSNLMTDVRGTLHAPISNIYSKRQILHVAGDVARRRSKIRNNSNLNSPVASCRFVSRDVARHGAT